jgi:hypothetical protein
MTRSQHASPLAVLAVVIASLGSASAVDPASIDETKATVPALSAFHEVIMPLWHEAWPNQNYALIKELLPKVQDHVREVQAAELPGILRDKKADWSRGVEALSEAAARYEKAVAANDEKGMLDAVEALHARFEGLVRVIRPAMKELDAYHVELYGLYHRLLPAKDFAAMPAVASALAEKCGALSAAAIPKRFEPKTAEIRGEIASLCRDTDGFKDASKGADPAATTAAVEKMHGQYQKLEAIFR